MSAEFQDPELQQLEALLRRTTPAAVPAHLIARIEAGLAAGPPSPTADEVKVVPFPGSRPARREPIRPVWSWGWAAAAVAMIGALVAALVPVDERDEPVVVSSQKWADSVAIPSSRAAMPMPASQVRDVRDEGVIWLIDGRPFRKIRVVYLDRHRGQDRSGKWVELNVPRIQYVLLPERVD